MKKKKKKEKMDILLPPTPPPESIYKPGPGLGGPGSSRLAARAGGEGEGRPARMVPGPAAPSRGPASLRPSAPPLLFSARGAGPRRGRSAHARAGRGRGGAGGGLRRRPPPPRPAPSGHCRISIAPRHNFAEAQRDPGARRRKYSPCRPAAAGRARAGLRGAARGARRLGAMRRPARAARGPRATCRAA